MPLDGTPEAVGGASERFIPRCAPQTAIVANQRLGESDKPLHTKAFGSAMQSSVNQVVDALESLAGRSASSGHPVVSLHKLGTVECVVYYIVAPA